MPPKTTELKTVLCPIFASAKDCSHLFGLSEKFIAQLAADGVVRCKKTGESKLAGKLYNVQDLYDWMTE